MSVKIKVPNKFYNGIMAGVTFHKGVALFEDEKLGKEIASRFGYEVIAVEVIEPEVETEKEPEVEAVKEPVKPKTAKKTAKKAVSKEGK